MQFLSFPSPPAPPPANLQKALRARLGPVLPPDEVALPLEELDLSGLDPAAQSSQRFPAGVRRTLIAGARLVVPIHAAARAKSSAVGLAQCSDRQRQKHLLPQHIFKQQTVFLIIPDFRFRRSNRPFRGLGIRAHRAEDQIKFSGQRSFHRLDAPRAGNANPPGKFPAKADIRDHLPGATVLVNHFGAAGGDQWAILLRLLAEIDRPWSQFQVEFHWLPFQFADDEFHTSRLKHFLPARPSDSHRLRRCRQFLFVQLLSRPGVQLGVDWDATNNVIPGKTGKVLQEVVMKLPRSLRWLLLIFAVALIPATSRAEVVISVGFAPPPLLVYDQPPCPDQGMIWTPGYWAYGPDGYYWVPGAWVPAPYVGALWTPGYWGWSSGMYYWHAGYWGPHVGYYGGINYGFGYFGLGFVGGMWRGNVFAYNTAVWHVNNVYVHNTYVDRTVIENHYVDRGSRVAFNGGPGGIRHDPSAQERTYMNESHMQRTTFQTQHVEAAMHDHNAYYNVNHGRPAQVVTSRPLAQESHPAPAERNGFNNNGARNGYQPNRGAQNQPEYRPVPPQLQHQQPQERQQQYRTQPENRQQPQNHPQPQQRQENRGNGGGHPQQQDHGHDK
jgi:hypothetical protein